MQAPGVKLKSTVTLHMQLKPQISEGIHCPPLEGCCVTRMRKGKLSLGTKT